ncbi:MAG: 50S ribosomal protein P1 [Candidatus Methanoplasma sp.]|jgi:large subunit ribosomal protein L12|nr:50S ribosomal protein P1 [Candidatus Methanoplasma sp.]
MEYIYSAMVLYSAGKEITEAAVSSVLSAAGVSADAAKVKALIASLEGVDIKAAIESAATVAAAPVAAAPAAQAPAAAAAKPEPEEEKVSEEDAAAGLSALFG